MGRTECTCSAHVGVPTASPDSPDPQLLRALAAESSQLHPSLCVASATRNCFPLFTPILRDRLWPIMCQCGSSMPQNLCFDQGSTERAPECEAPLGLADFSGGTAFGVSSGASPPPSLPPWPSSLFCRYLSPRILPKKPWMKFSVSSSVSREPVQAH